MTDHLTGRNTPFPPEIADQINGKLATIAKEFDEEWLSRTGPHPLQTLWARRDGLSTVELAWFGDAIQRMNIADPVWTKGELKKIKTGDANNRAGALFEVLGLSIFQCNNQNVKPVRQGNPGYDGIVSLSGAAHSYLSLKNYGTSTHEMCVRLHGKTLESRFVNLLTTRGLTGVGLRIVGIIYPTSAARWKELESHIDSASVESLQTGRPVDVGQSWMVVAHQLPEEYRPFHSRTPSYQFLLMIPHHANEAQNLLSKLGEACANFKKHPGSIPAHAARRVLVRLPPSASTEVCVRWAMQYFDDTKDPTLDGIFLYQPAGTMNALHHFAYFVSNCYASKSSTPPLSGEFFVGIVQQQPSKLMVTDGHTMITGDGYWPDGFFEPVG